MTWVRWDDNFYDHPKWIAVGPLGIALGHVATAWCNRNLTDGKIPVAKLSTLVSFDGLAEDGEPVTASGVANRLVEVGLWHAVPDGYEIHDYLDRQPSKAEVVEKRDKERKRWESRSGRNSEDPPASLRDGVAEDSDETPRATQTQTQSVSSNELTRPSDKRSASDGSFATDFDKCWENYPRKDARLAGLRAYKAQRRAGASAEMLLAATREYARLMRFQGRPKEKILYGSTFFGPDKRWTDFVPGANESDEDEEVNYEERERQSRVRQLEGLLAGHRKVIDPDLDTISELETELNQLQKVAS